MSYVADVFRGLATTLRNIARKPTTVQFPTEVRERTPRMRTSFALVHDEHGDEACIGCLQCERICPSEVITIKAGAKRESPATGKKRGYADDFTLDLSACILCELCVQVCPTDAILMTTEPEVPGYSRGDLFLTMERLYANEKGKTLSWGTATILMEMQDPKRGEPKAERPAKAAPAAQPATAASEDKPATAAAAATATATAPATAPAPAPATDPATATAPAPATDPATAAKPASVAPAKADAPTELAAPTPRPSKETSE